jgi:hypothetical protein
LNSFVWKCRADPVYLMYELTKNTLLLEFAEICENVVMESCSGIKIWKKVEVKEKKER